MAKQLSAILVAVILGAAMLTGCSGNNAQQTQAATEAVTAAEAAVTETAEEAVTEPAAEEATEAVTEAETEAAEEEAEAAEPAGEAALEDGVYLAEFNTDSSMFHVNEANDGKGILTVKDGKMVIHVALVSKNILNLYQGLAEDAQKDGAELLEPSVDSVTYSDGITEEVFGFDIPVPVLDEEFDCALVGNKGTWYDHKVSVTNPEPYEE